MATIDLPTELRNALYDQLEEGEKLVWAGQPDAWRVSRQTLPILFFAVPWTAFALFWMWGASGFGTRLLSGPAGVFPLFGVPFLLIGVAMLSSPAAVYLKALNTVYAVTDRRLVIFHGGKKQTLQTYRPEFIGGLHRTEGADGAGDLVFGGQTTHNGSTQVGFFGVPAVRHVEELLRETFGERLGGGLATPAAGRAPWWATDQSLNTGQ